MLSQKLIYSLFSLLLTTAEYVRGQDYNLKAGTGNVQQCMDTIQSLFDAEKYPALIIYFEKHDSLLRNQIGEYTLAYASCLDKYAYAMRSTQKMAESLNTALLAHQIKSALSDVPALDLAVTKEIVSMCYLSLGKLLEARRYCEECLNIRLKHLDAQNPEIANSYNNAGLISFEAAEYDEALNYHLKALSIRLDNYGEIHDRVAQSYNNLGRVYYQMGDFDQAYAHYQKALHIDEQLKGVNHPAIARSLHNMALLLNRMGYYHQSVNLYQRAIDISIHANGSESDIVAIHYNGLGAVLSDLGNYEKSNFYYYKSLKIKSAIFGDEHFSVGSIYNNLGINYALLNDVEKSEECHRKAFEIRTKTLSENHTLIGDSYHKLGLVYYYKKEYANAKSHLHKAVSTLKTALGNDHPKIANVLLDLSTVYLLEWDFQHSRMMLDEAHDIFLSNPLVDKAETGNLYSKYAAYFAAVDSIHLSEIFYLKSIQEFESQKLSYNINLIETEYQLSLLYEKKQKYTLAFEVCKRAISNIANLTITNYYDNTKRHFLTKNNKVIELGIRLSAVLYEVTKDKSYLADMFGFMETNKALLLYSNLIHSDALSLSTISSEMLEKEQVLKSRILAMEQKRSRLLNLSGNPNAEKSEQIESEIIELKSQYDDLIRQIEKENPDYYQLKYNKNAVTLQECQSGLNKGRNSLIYYFSGQEDIFALMVNADTVIYHRSPSSILPDSLFENFRFGLYGYHTTPIEVRNTTLYRKTVGAFRTSGFRLYEILLKPFEPMMNKELLIIHDGWLSFVPFDVLLTDLPTDKVRFRAYPFVLNKYSVSYDFSATIHYMLTQKVHISADGIKILAMAPFYDGNYKNLGLHSSLNSNDSNPSAPHQSFKSGINTSKKFNALPSSGEEIADISRMLEGDFLINKDATAESFARLAPSYAILHLSTHGVSDERMGDYSYVVFYADTAESDKALFTVKQIYGLKLKSDLVVLSACETAKGELQKSEGVIGLSRAFIYAGARSVLSSLWLIDDSSTKDVMKNFYMRLSSGIGKAEALRQAKIDFLHNTAGSTQHPFFWAAFTLYGSLKPLRIP
jgi:CHAT domain-containing protein/Flp pilus assembly protein TadD